MDKKNRYRYSNRSRNRNGNRDHDDDEPSHHLGLIRTSQEQQHLEAVLALSLQEYLLTTTARRANHHNRHQQTVPGKVHQELSLGYAQWERRGENQQEQDQSLVLRQIQQEQCRILERIREEQEEKERHRRLQRTGTPAFLPRHGDTGVCTIPEHELFLQQNQKTGGREERSTRQYYDSTPKTIPDLLQTAQQDLEQRFDDPPCFIMMTRLPLRLSSITTSSHTQEDSKQEEDVRQDPGSPLSIKVCTVQRREPPRKTLRRWNMNPSMCNQDQGEQVDIVGHQDEDENLILQRILQEQQQQRCRHVATTRREERAQRMQHLQESPRQVPAAAIAAEPWSTRNQVPTQPLFVEEHSEPPRIVTIPPQGSLNHQQNNHVSTVTMDNCIDHEDDGPGKILIKLGRLLQTQPQEQRMLRSNHDLIVTSEGCKSRLQVDCSYSLVFCPKCYTISPAVPVPYVTFHM